MKFTEYDKAIMIGLILGDGYISPKGRINVTHCEQQKEYIEYKAKLLHSVTGGKDINIYMINKISTYKKGNKIISQKEVVNYSFKRQSKDFIQFRELLYPSNRKTITKKVLNLLNPLAIALWWMDDGCLTVKYTYLNGRRVKCGYTLRFYTYLTKEENELIQQYFIDKYNMNWNVVKADNAKDSTQWMLRCGVHEGRKFLAIIRDIILTKVPSMSYKVLNI